MVYVGHCVDGNGIHLTDDRIQGLLGLQPPKTTAQLRSFVGMANYMRAFIPHFAEIAKPLHRLCSDKVPFKWDAICDQAFADIKRAVASAPILYHLDYSKPIVLRTDASMIGIGGTLLQRADGVDRPVCYLSRAFSEAESRWSTIEQEAFAVYYCITSLSHYLLGHRFTVETDHRNLVYLEKSVVPKLVRWRLRLQEYDFDVVHIAGRENVVADALSRCLVAVTSHDDEIKEAHNCIVGHRGIQATIDLLKQQGHSWPSMRSDVEMFLKTCPTCQKVRSSASDDAGTVLHTTAVAEPFHTVAIDTVGPLPADASGNRYVLVALDCFTRFVEMRASPAATAAEAATFLLEIFGRYGAPKYLRSDNGAQFVASVTQQLLLHIGTRPAYTIAYRPQSNGIVERANGEVGRHLRAIVMDRRLTNHWSQALPIVQRILNSTVHSSLGTTPSKLLFGDAINLNREILVDTPEASQTIETSEQADQYIRTLTDVQQAAVLASQEFQSKVVQKHLEKSCGTEVRFANGDYVLVKYPERAPSKISPKWKGPLVVTGSHGNVYACEDLLTGKIREYHVSRLKRFLADQVDNPVAVAVTDGEEWEVQEIVEHRGKGKKNIEFRIRWKGFGSEDDTWLGYSEVRDLAALDAYLESHPGLKL
eukprot:ANDGO_01279.mRNA.1 Retrovirus-related Pol polyprotein from transposon 412